MTKPRCNFSALPNLQRKVFIAISDCEHGKEKPITVIISQIDKLAIARLVLGNGHDWFTTRAVKRAIDGLCSNGWIHARINPVTHRVMHGE